MKKQFFLAIAIVNLSVAVSCGQDKIHQLSTFNSEVKSNAYTFSASKNKSGHNLSINIINPDLNPPLKGGGGLSTKANFNGSRAKTFSNIRSYEIYLIKNPNPTFPAT